MDWDTVQYQIINEADARSVDIAVMDCRTDGYEYNTEYGVRSIYGGMRWLVGRLAG